MSSLISKNRAVAPIIATLLMVAIAVVGGILIFVFTQGFFSDSQTSSSPNIETVAVIGFDARAQASKLQTDGNALNTQFTGTASKFAVADEIYVYLRNGSANDVIIDTLSLTGVAYTYDATGAATDAGGYRLLTPPNTGKTDGVSTLEPGEELTVAIYLSRATKVGQEGQVNIQTANGNTFLGTILFGTQRG